MYAQYLFSVCIYIPQITPVNSHNLARLPVPGAAQMRLPLGSGLGDPFTGHCHVGRNIWQIWMNPFWCFPYKWFQNIAMLQWKSVNFVISICAFIHCSGIPVVSTTITAPSPDDLPPKALASSRCKAWRNWTSSLVCFLKHVGFGVFWLPNFMQKLGKFWKLLVVGRASEQNLQVGEVFCWKVLLVFTPLGPWCWGVVGCYGPNKATTCCRGSLGSPGQDWPGLDDMASGWNRKSCARDKGKLPKRHVVCRSCMLWSWQRWC